ncbi:MAG TPA: gluconate 2-dehydrogenase subunit 3 family protein [Bryobacteraceae bacterium]|nr:gluconate 2-dehydrogenase subunit 3 family protein [Bryobacteraceae bacterium]
MSSRRTRREVLRNIAASVTIGAGLTAEAAQHVHHEAAEVKKKTAGVYKPRLFNEHEYRTVRLLAETIIPKDEVSGSALEAGAPEFIDLIASHNEDLATRLTGGLAWLDRTAEKRTGKAFLDAPAADRTAILDGIAFSAKAAPENAPGVVFFDWMRRLTADAFYTSPIGVKDIGYKGNKGMTVFEVPAAAIDYAVKRSGLA